MTSLQRVPVIEEVTLSDSDDEVTILDDDEPPEIKSVCKSTNESSRQVANKFPSQNIKFTLEQVYLQGDFDEFEVPESSDKTVKNSHVNSLSNASKHETFMDHQSHTDAGAESDDDQFYIDEGVKDPNTVSNEPIDLSLAREDERLSSISSSIMSPSSKSDDDKFSTVSSDVDTSKELLPVKNTKIDEKKLNNVFKDDVDMETGNATSDDEVVLAEGEMSMPSRDEKQFRLRGKAYVDVICLTCQMAKRMTGKIWQNKKCRLCQENFQFQCVKCKKRFTSYHSTLCHLKRECLSQKVWTCRQCPYSVLDERKLEEHIKKAHMMRRKNTKKADCNFFCERCNAGFKLKDRYQKHKCREQELYRCLMCDYTNKIKKEVTKHFNNYHTTSSRGKMKTSSNFISKIDSRPICVPDITSSSNISGETKRKTTEEIRAEEERLNKSIALHCSKCSKRFNYTGAHIKICEKCEGPLLWQCISCDELSKSYCGIYAHVQNSCGAIIKSCNKCKKRFDSDNDLVKHQHICGHDLYLQCELCDFKTRGKGFFLRHIKEKHDLPSHKNDEIRKWL